MKVLGAIRGAVDAMLAVRGVARVVRRVKVRAVAAMEDVVWQYVRLRSCSEDQVVVNVGLQ